MFFLRPVRYDREAERGGSSTVQMLAFRELGGGSKKGLLEDSLGFRNYLLRERNLLTTKLFVF